ncbi:HK97 gp10 family phage protein [Rathayibacter sp. AY1C5]|uniref:HK97 gp10 family phage protein n=1 Tax=Rathayibacter sp. AY1C5 TaxID=2080538 RepID=UPI0015E38272|nr:HK97 gp10 family phage protein [Rathayibacter sp. AY1C5]
MNIDARAVQKVFRELPARSVATLNGLILASAIDTQREMRKVAPVGASGDMRRAVKYVTHPSSLSAEIFPDTPYAEAVENGTRPHAVSARPGSSLARWARHKGIDPYAVAASIKKKGTKPHPFVKPTFSKARVTVPKDIINGMSRYIEGVNNGRI